MVLSMEKFIGKVAIVTGTSSGIGVSVAEQLVEYGLQVVAIARRIDRVEELAKKLEGKAGKLHPLYADVRNEDDIVKAFRWVKENLGPVYILVNNAGVSKPTNLLDGDANLWKDIIDTNVLGLSIATREAIRDMKHNNVDGHIIHINSIAGHRIANVPQLSVYPASKHAVKALTELLRQELISTGSKIRVTNISPGPVDTDLQINNNFPLGGAKMKFFNTTPKLLSDDLADAVIYALSTPPHVQIHEIIINPVGCSI